MRPKLGIWDGVRAFFGGCRFVLGTPRVWGWASVPGLVALGLALGLGALGIWGAWTVAGMSFSGPSPWTEAARWALAVVLGLALLLGAWLVALSLAQPLSGFALDRVVRAQALALGATFEPVAEPPFGARLRRSLAVSLAALALGLPVHALLAVIELFAPPAAVVTVPLGLAVSGLMLAWDFLDYPLGAKNATFGDRARFVRDHAGAIAAFGGLGALTLLVPGLGLVLLPMGAAGATRLVVAASRAAAQNVPAT